MINVEVFAQPFYLGDKKYGNMVFYNDISARLKAESDLEKTASTQKEVLDTLEDAYFEADPTGKFIYVNKNFVDSTRYLNKEELIGKNFRHLVSRKSIKKFITEFRKLYNNDSVEPFDLIYVTKDGAEFSSEIVVSPIREEGKTVGTRGIIRDISIRVKAEEILRNAKEAAELRAGELASINRVADKVSHSLDLQDILNSVCKELINIFPVRNAGISLHMVIESRLEVLAYHSIDPNEENHQGKTLDLEGNIEAHQIIDTGKTIIIQDAQTDSRTKPIHELISLSSSRAFMIVPLITRGKTIGLIGMTAEHKKYKFSNNEIELAETIASQIATAIDNAQLYEKTERALDVAERDLEIGREIQSGFFPRSIPEITGWEISTYFKAARQVSGDFYDLFPICDKGCQVVVVADVCDKGVGAALFMVLLRSLIRSYSEQHHHTNNIEDLLHNIAVKVNNYIVTTHGQSNMFATLFLGVLDSVTNKFYYVNGGQDPPILVDAKGTIKMELTPTGPAFGFSTDLSFEVGKVEFLSGDILLAYTDGLTEAKNSAGNFYTEERLLSQIKHEWPSSFSLLKHLEVDVFSHIGDQLQFDDITLVALRRQFDKKPDHHSFTLKGDMQNLPYFRKFAEDACLLLKAEENITETFKLAIDEVCSNLIIHGYRDMEVGNIYLTVHELESEILVQIEDTGHPFDPSLFAPPKLSDDIEERNLGGLGIFFVTEMVDEINYESKNGINCLSLKMRL